jgi:glucan biosynthesis protein C
MSGAPQALAAVRYHYLDALRAAMMFMGVFVHVSAVGDVRFFRLIASASNLFRMGGFFLVSGFFASMLILKYRPGPMVRRRLASVGVPFVVVLVLCNPVALWLMYNQHNPPIGFVDYQLGHLVEHPAGPPRYWHLHLWFLVALLFYTLCAPAVFGVLTTLARTRAFDWVAATRPRTMAALISFMLLATLVLQSGYLFALRPVIETTPANFVVHATLQCMPFFVVGMALFLDHQRLLPAFSRPAPVLLAACGGLLCVAKLGLAAPLASSLGDELVRSVLGLVIVVNLFALFQRFVNRERPILRYGADSAYSVYLLHYATIYVFAAVLGIGAAARFPDLLLITALTFAATLAVHHLLIRRYRVLAMLFNGKFASGGARQAGAGFRRQAAFAAAGPGADATVPMQRLSDRNGTRASVVPPADRTDLQRPRGGRHRAPKGADRRLTGP